MKTDEITLENHLRRLAFRSSHRGCKETDLLLGRFADKHLAALSPDLLARYEELLAEPDWDIWRWATAGDAPEQYTELFALMERDIS